LWNIPGDGSPETGYEEEEIRFGSEGIAYRRRIIPIVVLSAAATPGRTSASDGVVGAKSKDFSNLRMS
jgi:hypothetical protein